jgi:hypothetical protein
MTKQQYFTIGGVLLLFLVLYLGCERKAPKQAQVEKSRVLQAEATDVNVLMREAHDKLSSSDLGVIQVLQQDLANAKTDSLKLPILEKLSSTWMSSGHPAIAGHFAQQIAEIANTDEAWAITGTTFYLGIRRSEQEKARTFCSQRAVKAFENAISINPSEVKHQVNLALTYTELPPANEPMKGILMLRELETSFPQSALVQTTLARLAVQTGQFDRAQVRLEKALALEPDNKNAICLAAQVYANLGDEAKAASFDQQCQRLTGQ